MARMTGIAWMDPILRDVRFGLRVLWKDRGAMGAAALSLALALGACATAFSLIDALILRPLPVAHADRLFYLAWPDRYMRMPPGLPKEHDGFSYPVFRHMIESSGRNLDLFGANWALPLNPVIFDRASGERELVRIAALSGNAFRVLGVNAAAGRLFTGDDDAHSSASPVMAISHAFWKRRFGSDPSIIGKLATIADRQYQIIGVVEPRFTGLQPGYLNDVWIPLTAMFSAQQINSLDLQWVGIWGRTKPGNHAPEQALQAAFTNFRRDHAAQLLDRGTPPSRAKELIDAPLLFHSASSGADSIFRMQFTRPLWIVGLLSGLLLLIAASNVANLFLARSAGREREMAVRIAIGAGRLRLVRQLLIEGGLLSSLACAGAIGITAVAAPFFAGRLGASSLPAYLNVNPDWRLLVFLGVAGLLTTFFFGVVPALRASSVNPEAALRAGAQPSGRTRSIRFLLPLQVGFSFTMLFLSGLLLVSFNKLIHVDIGFDRDHVILFTVNTLGVPSDQQGPIAAQILDRVRHTNGVEAASISGQGPMGGAVLGFVASPFIRFPGREMEKLRPENVTVSPGFFTTMRIRMLKGREFEPRDEETSPSTAAVVNQDFARRFFAGADPIGQHFDVIGDDKPQPKEIVGVVANSLFNDLRAPIVPTIYSLAKNLNGATLEVRTSGNPLALSGILRRTIESVHPAVRVRNSILQSTRIDDTLTRERMLAWLGGFFAISAIVLVAVGLNGVISYSVVRRTREIGIRVALGAQRIAVLRLIIGDVSALICLGVIFGMAGGIALVRYVASLLFEVKATEFWSVAAPLGCLLAASAVAALRPAVRAVRVDPVIALRYE